MRRNELGPIEQLAKKENFNQEEKKESQQKHQETIFEHLGMYQSAWETEYMQVSRHQKAIGFTKPEQRIAQKEILELREVLTQFFKDKNFLIGADNNLNHIFGNAICARSLMINFSKGKYYDKEFPFEKFKIVKREIEALRNYTKCILEKKEILEAELSASVGYLGKYLNFFRCDLPKSSVRYITVLNFFLDLEKGIIRRDDFAERLKKVQNDPQDSRVKDILDEKIIEENIFLFNQEGEEYYKLNQ